MFFKKKVKTKKEQEVFDIISGMCQVPSTEVRVDPMTMEFFLSLKEGHYDIIISKSTVVITNSKFSLRESFPDYFITELKRLAAKRASADRQKIKEEILQRERLMLEEAKTNILNKIERYV